MAVTTINSNNKLIQFTKDINREFVRENLFSPYMGEGLDAIIRRKMDTKTGGEQINIPLVTKLNGTGKSTGTLAGSEERVNNYGMRAFIDWWRHAVVTNKAENFKDSADIFGEAKSLLSDRGKEIQRDELLASFFALPSESAPANLGTDEGQRVNGILWDQATAAQRNTWLNDNVDRVLFGNAISNHVSGSTVATATSALSVIGSVKLTSTVIGMLKRRAEVCSPKIRPYKTKDGYEYYVIFAGSYAFRDAFNDTVIYTANKDARSREGQGLDGNPIFQDGDLLYDGVIIRKVPEISMRTTDTWTSLASASVSGRVEPVFLCGQQAATIAFGQMAKPTFRKEDDYGFITGSGVEMAYGVAKNFMKTAMYGTNVSTGAQFVTNANALVQWGMVTGFVYASIDS